MTPSSPLSALKSCRSVFVRMLGKYRMLELLCKLLSVVLSTVPLLFRCFSSSRWYRLWGFHLLLGHRLVVVFFFALKWNSCHKNVNKFAIKLLLHPAIKEFSITITSLIHLGFSYQLGYIITQHCCKMGQSLTIPAKRKRHNSVNCSSHFKIPLKRSLLTAPPLFLTAYSYVQNHIQWTTGLAKNLVGKTVVPSADYTCELWIHILQSGRA